MRNTVAAMSELTNLDRLLPEFQAACAAAEVKPRAALAAGGLDPSLWLKWLNGDASPTLKSLTRAQEGLRALTAARKKAA